MFIRVLARVAAIATVVVIAAGTGYATQAASARSLPVRRGSVDLTVPVGVDGLHSATIHAVRYAPAARPRGVQILVPGVTYDHHYYDLVTAHGLVSQARQAAADGWVTYAVDRLGTGRSGKPPANEVTTATNVAALTHFADRVGHAFRRLPLVIVGHSYGSVVAEGVAAASRRVDALVVTGFLYRQSSPSFDGFPALVPAAGDPVFAGTRLPAGYETTTPGSRSFFYYLANADRATVRADERTKATTTDAEVPGFAQELFSGTYAGQIRVPVLVAVGEYDFLYRGDNPTAFAPDQRAAFAASPSVTARVVPYAAHDLALQRNAPSTTALIDRWIRRQACGASS